LRKGMGWEDPNQSNRFSFGPRRTLDLTSKSVFPEKPRFNAFDLKWRLPNRVSTTTHHQRRVWQSCISLQSFPAARVFVGTRRQIVVRPITGNNEERRSELGIALGKRRYSREIEVNRYWCWLRRVELWFETRLVASYSSLRPLKRLRTDRQNQR
jgi:hypothetical protein